MSALNPIRKSVQGQVASLYRHKFLGVTWCVYCGEAATGRDHVIPMLWAATALQLDTSGFRTLRRWLVTVPACSSCNSIGADRVFASLSQKREFIQKNLRTKLRKMASVRWDEDELAEVGYHLRTHIVAKQNEYDRLRRRAYWPRYK